MKVRQSASLVAGVCTLCVAASTSVSPVPAAAATPEAKSAVVRPFELTAASDVLVDSVNVASLPLQNFITVLNALAGAAGGGNGTGGGGATSLQALPNVLYSQLVAGSLTSESATAAINAALGAEQTALANLSATPGKISATDLAAINTLLAELGFGSLGVAAAATPFKAAAVTSDVSAADSGTTVVDAINVASLPLQNGITALNALAGAAGGGNGVGGGGATSFQALPNLLYSQLVAGTLTSESATAAINAALATEQTALINLAATPGKVIATDVPAIQKLAGDFGTGTLSVNKLQTNTPALKSTDVAPAVDNVVATPPADNTPKLKASPVVTNKVADQNNAKDATAGLTTPARHAAKANDNNPVSNAIKAIKEASKGSYVGKHRADAVGAKASAGNGEDGSTS